MADKNKEKRVGLRPFDEILAEMAQGDVLQQLTTELAKVVAACEDTGQKGELKVNFVIKPGPKMMHVGAKITATIPRPALEATSFFVDDKGSLSVDNPRQVDMFTGPQVVKQDGEN